ncbi:hypothetical protein TSAR_006918 [Trichomalopsis sarcophagae]|uniref:Uncharacterized protein n=1 Tax=Trichomalopsis sarcophagae TaxID=543379 RepID=A0A232EI95_9HYME|nr:hypothetical protein TSAR_006918 [Trichomalopsis sarcophagae]
MAKCQTSGKRSATAEFPNLLLSTTYALNKSNSKRVCIGLEYSDGNGPMYKNITLDENSWTLLKDQFDAITAYLNNSYSFYHEFGHQVKIYLTNHDLNFAVAYGIKSITIDERPKNTQPSGEDEEGEIDQPVCKKMKTSNPPGIVMQHPIFEGLRLHSSLVDQRLDALKTLVGKINRTYVYVLQYLKTALEAEELRNIKNILTDFKEFKQFYSRHNIAIEGFVLDKMVDDNNDKFKEQYLRIVLSEILVSGLPFIAKDVLNYVTLA